VLYSPARNVRAEAKPMRHERVVAAMALAGLALGLLVAGCGSVGEVGYGASRAGVEPVRGAYGNSPYAPLDARKQSERVNSLAKANERTGKQTAALANKAKALPDADGPAVAPVETPTQPTLEPQIKALVVQQETRPPSASDRMAADYGDDY